MFRSWLSSWSGQTKARPRRKCHKPRLGLECLETRELLASVLPGSGIVPGYFLDAAGALWHEYTPTGNIKLVTPVPVRDFVVDNNWQMVFALERNGDLVHIPVMGGPISLIDHGIRAFDQGPDGTIYELFQTGELDRWIFNPSIDVAVRPNLDYSIQSFAVAADGSVYELFQSGEFDRWILNPSTNLATRPHVNFGVQSFALDADGQHVLDLSRTGVLDRWDSSTGAHYEINPGVQSFAPSQFGVYILYTSGEFELRNIGVGVQRLDYGVQLFAVADGGIRVYELKTDGSLWSRVQGATPYLIDPQLRAFELVDGGSTIDEQFIDGELWQFTPGVGRTPLSGSTLPLLPQKAHASGVEYTAPTTYGLFLDESNYLRRYYAPGTFTYMDYVGNESFPVDSTGATWVLNSGTLNRFAPTTDLPSIVGTGVQAFALGADGNVYFDSGRTLYCYYPSTGTEDSAYLSLGGLSEWTRGQLTPSVFGSGAAIGGLASHGTLSIAGLPPGLPPTYSGTVVTVSGTPTVAGTYTATLTWSDPNCPLPLGGLSPSWPIKINPPPTLSGLTARPWSVGKSDSATITISGGTGSYVASYSGQLPTGLNLARSGSVITISGTPQTAGSFTFTVTVRDSTGASASQTDTVSLIPYTVNFYVWIDQTSNVVNITNEIYRISNSYTVTSTSWASALAQINMSAVANDLYQLAQNWLNAYNAPFGTLTNMEQHFYVSDPLTTQDPSYSFAAHGVIVPGWITG
jgi:hypothetical protein